MRRTPRAYGRSKKGLPTYFSTSWRAWSVAFFSMEHSAKHQSCMSARLASSASIHSLLPLLGTPVTIVSSPGTTL
jgi:hypothetical protein